MVSNSYKQDQRIPINLPYSLTLRLSRVCATSILVTYCIGRLNTHGGVATPILELTPTRLGLIRTIDHGLYAL